MNKVFKQKVDSLQAKCEVLLAMAPVSIGALPRQVPKRGIYLFSEGGQHLYTGRTNNLRARLQGHVSNSHYSATFAFLLARLQTGRTRPSYKKKGSRADLLNDPGFQKAFNGSREQIRQMNVRYVEEVDPIAQALLEIYIALATKAEHNSFDNH